MIDDLILILILLFKQKNFMHNEYLILATAISVSVLFYFMMQYRKLITGMRTQARQQKKELQLLHALLLDEEKERLQITKRLHDGVSGMVAAVKMYFSSIPSAKECVEQTEGYQKGMHLLNEIASEVRKTSHSLTPAGILENGLDDGLYQYCTKLNYAHDIHVQYDSWGDIGRFTESFELSAYRIVQELLQVMIKELRHQSISVQMTQQDHLLTIAIEACQTDQKESDLYVLFTGLETRIRQMDGKIELNASPENNIEAYLEFETAGLTKQLTDCNETN